VTWRLLEAISHPALGIPSNGFGEWPDGHSDSAHLPVDRLAGGIWVGWAKIRDAMLIAGLVVITLGSALVSTLATYPNPAHRQLLAKMEQLFPRWP
jgi:hypothetical protein